MSDIETNLNQSPYFDDFDEDKNFHRVLFRPGYAVQARELTQLQTMLQKQLGRLSNEVFIDGVIVTGGGFGTTVVQHVKLRDKDANNRSLIISDFFNGTKIANLTITGATTGMTAQLISATAGTESNAPDYFTVHCYYTNSGSNNTVKAFANNETLLFRWAANNTFKVAANTITTGATGSALKGVIRDGIIYHKENFIKFDAQSVIIGKYTHTPNAYVGFETTETIVDSNDDQSLLDNASGSSNYTAPGANRLKITPTLTTKPYGFSNTASFFRIAEIRNGVTIQKPLDRNLSTIGKFVAERIYDSSGNFAVTPFNIRIRESLNKPLSLGRLTAAEGGRSDELIAEIEPGTAYVNGERIRSTATQFLILDKATDIDTEDAVVIGQQYGHYVNVKEVVGTWDFQGLRTVSLRDTRQHGISGENLGAQAVSGTEIGTARVRGIEWDSGTPGTYNAQYRIYLFDVSMNSGQSFADVRGLYVNNASGPKSMADIVLETNGSAKIQEPGLNSLVFPTGLKAVKQYTDSTGTNDTQFVFRTEKTVNFATNGTATVTANTAHAGGTETMNETGSPLTNAEERNLIVVARETVSTQPHTGTVTQSGNTVTGVGTAFTTQYQVGDFIKIGSNDPMRITEISGSTTLKTANTQTVAGASAHSTTFPIGYIFDLSGNGQVTSTSSSHTIDLQQANLASTFSASVYFNRLRSAAVPASKTVNKNKFVHINTGSHSASNDGPWPLGVSDAFKIVAVYQGSNTGVTSSDTDVTTHFELDNGMKDGFYDTSYLKKKATSTLNITNAGLLVKFNYFGRDRSAGIGFLTVDSYPIDDTNSANTTAIMTQEIPVFTSPTSGVRRDLRDSVDFRPIKSNTVTPSANAVATQTPSITNPTASSAYNIDSDGAHMPTPNENFQADIQYYLPRRDRIVVNPVGRFSVVKGISDLSPQTPATPTPSMSLATLEIPPYPSLAPYYAQQFDRLDYQVKMALDNNRRYTMADLRAVDSRVKSLEYYSSLNLLENLTLNKQVFNEATATDRFKNGFFVDNFVNLKFADTQNPYLRVGIDKDEGILRPSYRQNYVPMNSTIVDTAGLDSTNYQKTGDLVTLSYTHREFNKQPYASKKRNAAQELFFNWEGRITLDPAMDNVNDTTTLPELQVDFDGFYESIMDTLRFQGVDPSRVEFGNWRTTSSRREGRVITTTQDRIITTTTLGSITEEISLGNSVNSVSVREFMRSKIIRFTGFGMRPNTKVYPYFDKEKVFSYCTPTNSSFVATGVEGANLVTDSTGTIYGLFRLPNDDNLKFRQGTKRFELTNISDPATEIDLVTTSSFADYTSISLDVSEQERTINVKLPQLSTEVETQTQTTVTVLPPPPPPRPAWGGGGWGGWQPGPRPICFVAGTQVRMADGSNKNIEDVEIGEEVLGQDNSVNKVLDFDHNPLEGKALIGINGAGAFMTKDHPLMTREGWKAYDSELVKQNKAELAHLMTNGNLQIGDEILTVDGSWMEVTSLEVFLDEPEQTVYNFVLDGNNTYFADGLLAHNRGGCCFVAGTPVTMSDGSTKKIEDIEIGEVVLGKDNQHNTVQSFIRPKLGKRKLMGVNGSDAFVTADHPLWTQDGWKAHDIETNRKLYPHLDMAGALEVGDKLLNTAGEWTEIESIETFAGDEELQVYNFSLNGNKTYFGNDILAHNKGGGGDPLAQSFDVIPDNSIDGVYVTKVDLFFARKHSSLPVILEIREMENGVPTKSIVGQKVLYPASVNVSADASVATTFTFDNLVFLNSGKDYCLVVTPGANNEEYEVWIAEMGGEDVLLPNVLINKQTASGVLMVSANDSTWSNYQDEDMKYTIYTAKFNTGSATVYIDNDEMDYLTIDKLDGNLQVGENVVAESVLTFANNQTISVGDIIKSKHAANNNSVRHAGYANGVVRQVVGSSSGSVTVKVDPFGTFSTTATGNTNNLYVDGTWVGNTSAFTANTAQGTVSFYYGVAGKMHLSSSAGGFANGYVRGQTSGGSARVVSVDNLVMNTLVPKLPVITHANTGATFSVRSTSTGGTISSGWKSVTLGTDNNFKDGEKKVYSYSNETSLSAVNGSTKSLMLRAILSSNNDNVSPVIDMSRANMLIVENEINNDATDEHKTYGNAKMRYMSKPVELADGQDAEDLVVFMDAYKPVNSDIKVYARLLNAEDGETLEDKDFTLMTQITASNTFSSGLDGTDFKEFEFGFSANTNGQGFLTSANNFARLNSANSNVVAYRGTDGSIYHTYKTFALKIVMTSAGTHIVPKVTNIRAVALQK